MRDATGKTEFWPIVRQAFIALNRGYWPAIENAAKALNIESPSWQYLLYVLVFKGEPLSAPAMRVRGPYTSARLFEERFETLLKLGYLVRKAGTSAYFPTASGLSAANKFVDAARSAMAKLSPLPLPELERLATLLERVVNACLKPPMPLDGWCLKHSMNLAPGRGAHVVARIDQCFSDLAAYRDDCHLSSWKAHKIDGHTWEILTFVWRNQADSLDTVREKLKHRGFTLEETTHALQELLNRGWIAGTPVRYSVTAVGSDVRQRVQDATDALFNAPFACLNDTEKAELLALLQKLTKALEN